MLNQGIMFSQVQVRTERAKSSKEWMRADRELAFEAIVGVRKHIQVGLLG